MIIKTYHIITIDIAQIIDKHVQICSHGLKWTEIDQTGPKWTNRPDWTEIDLTGPNWTKMDEWSKWTE